jgi:photosystem II stability/assembly factor-like uncharacterized protein
MRRRTVLFVALLTGALAIAGMALAAKPPPKPKKAPKSPQAGSFAWQLTPTGSTARLRGLAPVSANVVWASGSEGTVLRTTNRGATWQSVGPPGTSALQFRDIEAFGPNRAVILSIGEGGDSRIYFTTDAGQNWTLAFQNDDPTAFYDCMTFFNKKRGLALSDPPVTGGKFRILATSNGGRTWNLVDPAGMPPALTGEFAFAASGQCITSNHGRRAWFGTGGGAEARVFTSSNRGRTWHVASTPMNVGPSAGIFALAFRSQQHGLAVGGDFTMPTNSPDNFARTRNGGASWQLISGAPAEYRSSVTWVNGHTAIAVGPSGSDASRNGGRTWTGFDDGSFDTVDCARPTACWASGEQGRVAYLVR